MALDLVDAMASGQVKAVWVMATNPLVSLPQREKVERAFEHCELVVVSDCIAKNDTLDFAHVKLPATGWSEKDGMVTNSERRLSRQRGLIPAQGNARHDWRIICDVAKAMGFDGFDFKGPVDIFNEHIALSAFNNQGQRDFDLSGLGHLSQTQYDSFRPIQWPVTQSATQGTKRLFTDKAFFTKNKKANFVAVAPLLPRQHRSEDFPFVLNSGRIRDQWHTMTRTGQSYELSRHTERPYIAINPLDAKALEIGNGDYVEICSKVSLDKPVCLNALLDDGIRPGECFSPIHWSEQNSGSAGIASLFAAVGDPISGQPELKHAAVRLAKIDVKQCVNIVCKHSLAPKDLNKLTDIWVSQVVEHGFSYSLMLRESRVNWRSWLQTLLDIQGQWLSFDNATEQRVFVMNNEGLQLFLSATDASEGEPKHVSPDWLLSNALTDSARSQLLHGNIENMNASPVVCSCFNVTEKAIYQSIEQGDTTVEQLGKKLKCGTNCGSCKPEISALITKQKEAYVDLNQEVMS